MSFVVSVASLSIGDLPRPRSGSPFNAETLHDRVQSPVLRFDYEGDVLILPALGSLQAFTARLTGGHIPTRIARRDEHHGQSQPEGENLPHGVPVV